MQIRLFLSAPLLPAHRPRGAAWLPSVPVGTSARAASPGASAGWGASDPGAGGGGCPRGRAGTARRPVAAVPGGPGRSRGRRLGCALAASSLSLLRLWLKHFVRLAGPCRELEGQSPEGSMLSFFTSLVGDDPPTARPGLVIEVILKLFFSSPQYIDCKYCWARFM